MLDDNAWYIKTACHFGTYKHYNSIMGLQDHGCKDLSPMRYKPISEEEERVIIKVDSLIKKYFPGYGFIDESQHQIVVSNIGTAFKSGPTIFEAIFTENEN